MNERELLWRLKETEEELKQVVPLSESDALIGFEDLDINISNKMLMYKNYWVGGYIEHTLLNAKEFLIEQ